MRIAAVPSFTAPLRPIPNYRPMEGTTQSNPTAALRPLGHGSDSVMRGTQDGPFQLRNDLERDGSFNLEALVCQATAWRWHAAFTAQWDGSMCHSCAVAVCRAMGAAAIPREPAHFHLRNHEFRRMSHWSGPYASYWDHAMDHQ
eukprot:4291088-Pyramimonas_sp.AAC.1